MAKEMKTLGGYEIVDEQARQDIETLQTEKASVEELNVVSEKADEALTLVKGATRAFVYNTYSDMISDLNTLDKTELSINYHIMIRTVCVPDLWISGVSDEHVEYTYTSNEDFIIDLTEDGVVQVGYFVLSALETQKVNLDDYVKNTDYATSNNAGVVKVAGYGIKINDKTGEIQPNIATENSIDVRHAWHMLNAKIIDYAVKKALSDCKLTGDDVWTDEEKASALELLGGVPLKVTTGSTNKYNQVYAINTSGDVYMVSFSWDAIVDTLAIREEGGALKVGTPTADTHATTKKYVDDLVGDIEASLDSIIAIQEALIGGESA